MGQTSFFGLRALNVGLLAGGLVAIAVGYVLLNRGSTVAAPLLLLLGYAVLVPAALLVGLRRPRDPDAGEGE
ncbi:MAG: hypothetical protein ACODAB_04275 [Gemmatimonadota bacterium]